MSPAEITETLDMWTVVMGFLIPILISFFKDKDWTTETKQLLTFGVIIPFAAVYTYLEGTFDVQDLVINFVKILASTVTFYNLYWKKTNLETKITEIGVGNKKVKK